MVLSRPLAGRHVASRGVTWATREVTATIIITIVTALALVPQNRAFLGFNPSQYPPFLCWVFVRIQRGGVLKGVGWFPSRFCVSGPFHEVLFPRASSFSYGFVFQDFLDFIFFLITNDDGA